MEGIFIEVPALHIESCLAQGNQTIARRPFHKELVLDQQGKASVGAGDGGNEIGTGKLADVTVRIPDMIDEPPVMPATHLDIVSASNWGGNGLVAAFSILEDKDPQPNGDR